MAKQWLWLVLMISSFLTLGGCNSSGGGETPTEAPPPEAAAPSGEVPNPETAETTPEEGTEAVFDDPVIAAASVSGLRKATDPQKRLQGAQTGRPNPFEGNPIPVTVILPSPKPLPPLPPGNRGLPTLPSVPLAPGPGSSILTPNPLIPVVPLEVLPDPALAKQVEVMGVVQVGSVRQAILRAPLEASSRYVREGQRVAEGQVLVKRIEVRGSEPVVILEESGVEVVKFVGAQPEETPGEPQSGTTPAGAPTIVPSV